MKDFVTGFLIATGILMSWLIFDTSMNYLISDWSSQTSVLSFSAFSVFFALLYNIKDRERVHTFDIKNKTISFAIEWNEKAKELLEKTVNISMFHAVFIYKDSSLNIQKSIDSFLKSYPLQTMKEIEIHLKEIDYRLKNKLLDREILDDVMNDSLCNLTIDLFNGYQYIYILKELNLINFRRDDYFPQDLLFEIAHKKYEVIPKTSSSAKHIANDLIQEKLDYLKTKLESSPNTGCDM